MTKLAFFYVVPGYNANSQINVAHVRYGPHTTAGRRLIILPLWNASLGQPAGNTPLLEAVLVLLVWCLVFSPCSDHFRPVISH